MKSKSYHHGDLRHALIDTGIKLMNQYGEERLSLRKVAEECGVSNAAPYAHFKSKDEFIGAMQQHVLKLFTAALEETVEKYKNSNSLLSMLGKSYVMFFYQNPIYFDFLFSQKNLKVTVCCGTRQSVMTAQKPAHIKCFMHWMKCVTNLI